MLAARIAHPVAFASPVDTIVLALIELPQDAARAGGRAMSTITQEGLAPTSGNSASALDSPTASAPSPTV